jgi:hypothetical protein
VSKFPEDGKIICRNIVGGKVSEYFNIAQAMCAFLTSHMHNLIEMQGMNNFNIICVRRFARCDVSVIVLNEIWGLQYNTH